MPYGSETISYFLCECLWILLYPTTSANFFVRFGLLLWNLLYKFYLLPLVLYGSETITNFLYEYLIPFVPNHKCEFFVRYGLLLLNLLYKFYVFPLALCGTKTISNFLYEYLNTCVPYHKCRFFVRLGLLPLNLLYKFYIAFSFSTIWILNYFILFVWVSEYLTYATTRVNFCHIWIITSELISFIYFS